MLSVENLSKTFRVHTLGNKLIEAINSVSFRMGEGEFLGLTGPSGAGKSTILKCIYRTYLPTQGEIWFESGTYGQVNLSTLGNHRIISLRKNEIGYVSQFLKVIPRVSAIDVVAEPLLTKNRASDHEARRKAEELLTRLNIPKYLFDAYPGTFSGGEQQRVNIARAVIWKPRLLLLDEPTASLDKASVSIVVDILKQLKEEGSAMIGIFHDYALMQPIIDNLYRISQEGDIHETH